MVKKLKWFAKSQLHLPKFKIGHAGTLDPLATGLLVICTGKATKQIETLQGGEKEYTGTIRFGQTTASYDLETEPEGDFPFVHLKLETIKQAATNFLGEQLQRPPVFSAKKIDGKRAYLAARSGKEIEMREALVTIHEFEITRCNLPEVDFRIRCSKGTYIRSLAHELGQRLGSGSHLSALRRTASAPYTVQQAHSPDDIITLLQEMALEKSPAAARQS